MSSKESYTPAAHVEPLRYSGIANCVNTMFVANEYDPMIRYFAYDMPNFSRTRFRFQYGLIFRLQLFPAVYTRRVLTIGEGDAFVSFTPPGKQQGVIERVVSAVAGWLEKVLRSINTAELKHRRTEYADKLGVAIKSAFGDNVNNMMSLDSISTIPSKQGRGYGRELVRSVTAKADAEGRSTWLVSSNVANTTFYGRCGFSVAGQFALGDSNPLWDKGPIIVRVVGSSIC
ncbi:hypothetical protein B0H21DRAFT_740954 [Amylocystis lapponica]|nr:hypothetical protein B0H21DRAFT_740954 [Amylocystis lapponica]